MLTFKFQEMAEKSEENVRNEAEVKPEAETKPKAKAKPKKKKGYKSKKAQRVSFGGYELKLFTKEVTGDEPRFLTDDEVAKLKKLKHGERWLEQYFDLVDLPVEK